MTKKIRQIITITILVIISLVTTNFKSFSQSTEYYTQQAMLEFANIICTPSSAVIASGNFMGCTVEFLVNVTSCTYQDPNCQVTRHISFFNISSVDWDYDNCSSLTSYLFPGYPDNWGTLNEYGFTQMLKSLDEQFSTQYFADFYNSLSANEQLLYNCVGTPPNCQFPTECSATTIISSKAKCEKLCLAMKLDGPTIERFYVGYLPCDDENMSCCVTQFEMCMCGTQIKQTETSWPTTNACIGALSPQMSCFIPSGYTPIYEFDHCVGLCD